MNSSWDGRNRSRGRGRGWRGNSSSRGRGLNLFSHHTEYRGNIHNSRGNYHGSSEHYKSIYPANSKDHSSWTHYKDRAPYSHSLLGDYHKSQFGFHHRRPFQFQINFQQPAVRSSSPLPGSEEYMQRDITEKSAFLKRQLELEEPLDFNKGFNDDNVIDQGMTSYARCDNDIDNDQDLENKSEEQSKSEMSPRRNKKLNKRQKQPEEMLSVEEIHDKIINHIANLSHNKKINFLNQSVPSGYDTAVQQITRQKRLELSKALRDICKDKFRESGGNSSQVIEAIIPDFDIKIEMLPREVVEQLSSTLDEDIQEHVQNITVDPELMFQQAANILNNMLDLDETDKNAVNYSESGSTLSRSDFDYPIIQDINTRETAGPGNMLESSKDFQYMESRPGSLPPIFSNCTNISTRTSCKLSTTPLGPMSFSIPPPVIYGLPPPPKTLLDIQHSDCNDLPLSFSFTNSNNNNSKNYCHTSEKSFISTTAFNETSYYPTAETSLAVPTEHELARENLNLNTEILKTCEASNLRGYIQSNQRYLPVHTHEEEDATDILLPPSALQTSSVKINNQHLSMNTEILKTGEASNLRGYIQSSQRYLPVHTHEEENAADILLPPSALQASSVKMNSSMNTPILSTGEASNLQGYIQSNQRYLPIHTHEQEDVTDILLPPPALQASPVEMNNQHLLMNTEILSTGEASSLHGYIQSNQGYPPIHTHEEEDVTDILLPPPALQASPVEMNNQHSSNSLGEPIRLTECLSQNQSFMNSLDAPTLKEIANFTNILSTENKHADKITLTPNQKGSETVDIIQDRNVSNDLQQIDNNELALLKNNEVNTTNTDKNWEKEENNELKHEVSLGDDWLANKNDLTSSKDKYISHSRECFDGFEPTRSRRSFSEEQKKVETSSTDYQKNNISLEGHRQIHSDEFEVIRSKRSFSEERKKIETSSSDHQKNISLEGHRQKHTDRDRSRERYLEDLKSRDMNYSESYYKCQMDKEDSHSKRYHYDSYDYKNEYIDSKRDYMDTQSCSYKPEYYIHSQSPYTSEEINDSRHKKQHKKCHRKQKKKLKQSRKTSDLERRSSSPLRNKRRKHTSKHNMLTNVTEKSGNLKPLKERIQILCNLVINKRPASSNSDLPEECKIKSVPVSPYLGTETSPESNKSVDKIDCELKLSKTFDPLDLKEEFFITKEKDAGKDSHSPKQEENLESWYVTSEMDQAAANDTAESNLLRKTKEIDVENESVLVDQQFTQNVIITDQTETYSENNSNKLNQRARKSPGEKKQQMHQNVTLDEKQQTDMENKGSTSIQRTWKSPGEKKFMNQQMQQNVAAIDSQAVDSEGSLNTLNQQASKSPDEKNVMNHQSKQKGTSTETLESDSENKIITANQRTWKSPGEKKFPNQQIQQTGTEDIELESKLKTVAQRTWKSPGEKKFMNQQIHSSFVLTENQQSDMENKTRPTSKTFSEKKSMNQQIDFESQENTSKTLNQRTRKSVGEKKVEKQQVEHESKTVEKQEPDLENKSNLASQRTWKSPGEKKFMNQQVQQNLTLPENEDVNLNNKSDSSNQRTWKTPGEKKLMTQQTQQNFKSKTKGRCNNNLKEKVDHKVKGAEEKTSDQTEEVNKVEKNHITKNLSIVVTNLQLQTPALSKYDNLYVSSKLSLNKETSSIESQAVNVQNSKSELPKHEKSPKRSKTVKNRSRSRSKTKELEVSHSAEVPVQSNVTTRVERSSNKQRKDAKSKRNVATATDKERELASTYTQTQKDNEDESFHINENIRKDKKYQLQRSEKLKISKSVSVQTIQNNVNTPTQTQKSRCKSVQIQTDLSSNKTNITQSTYSEPEAVMILKGFETNDSFNEQLKGLDISNRKILKAVRRRTTIARMLDIDKEIERLTALRKDLYTFLSVDSDSDESNENHYNKNINQSEKNINKRSRLKVSNNKVKNLKKEGIKKPSVRNVAKHFDELQVGIVQDDTNINKSYQSINLEPNETESINGKSDKLILKLKLNEYHKDISLSKPNDNIQSEPIKNMKAESTNEGTNEYNKMQIMESKTVTALAEKGITKRKHKRKRKLSNSTRNSKSLESIKVVSNTSDFPEKTLNESNLGNAVVDEAYQESLRTDMVESKEVTEGSEKYDKVELKEDVTLSGNIAEGTLSGNIAEGTVTEELHNKKRQLAASDEVDHTEFQINSQAITQDPDESPQQVVPESETKLSKKRKRDDLLEIDTLNNLQIKKAKHVNPEFSSSTEKELHSSKGKKRYPVSGIKSRHARGKRSKSPSNSSSKFVVTLNSKTTETDNRSLFVNITRYSIEALEKLKDQIMSQDVRTDSHSRVQTLEGNVATNNDSETLLLDANLPSIKEEENVTVTNPCSIVDSKVEKASTTNIGTSNDIDDNSIIKQEESDEDCVRDFDVLSEAVLTIKVVESTIISATDKGNLLIFDMLNGNRMHQINLSKVAITSIITIKKESTHFIYAGCLDSYIYIVDFNDPQITKKDNLSEPIQCMENAWDFMFVGSDRGSLIRYNLSTEKIAQVLQISDTNVLVMKATQEGPRKVLVVATRNAAVSIRDALSGLLLRELQTPFSPTVYTLLFNKNLIYCGTSQHDILVYTFEDGQLIFKHEATKSKGVVCMQIVGSLLFAGCYNGNIYVYNTNSNVHLGTMNGPGGLLLSMEIVNNKIIVGTKSSKFRQWKIPQKYLDQM